MAKRCTGERAACGRMLLRHKAVRLCKCFDTVAQQSRLRVLKTRRTSVLAADGAIGASFSTRSAGHVCELRVGCHAQAARRGSPLARRPYQDPGFPVFDTWTCDVSEEVSQ